MALVVQDKPKLIIKVTRDEWYYLLCILILITLYWMYYTHNLTGGLIGA